MTLDAAATARYRIQSLRVCRIEQTLNRGAAMMASVQGTARVAPCHVQSAGPGDTA